MIIFTFHVSFGGNERAETSRGEISREEIPRDFRRKSHQSHLGVHLRGITQELDGRDEAGGQRHRRGERAHGRATEQKVLAGFLFLREETVEGADQARDQQHRAQHRVIRPREVVEEGGMFLAAFLPVVVRLDAPLIRRRRRQEEKQDEKLRPHPSSGAICLGFVSRFTHAVENGRKNHFSLAN